MGYVVRMPKLGMTMESGNVVEWRSEIGEDIEEDEVVAIVESEKTTNEVTARTDGQVLARFVEPMETIEPGDPIAYFGEAGESVPEDIGSDAESVASDRGETTAMQADNQSLEPAAAEEISESTSDGVVPSASDTKVSPRARAHARENGIDLSEVSSITPSGPDGAIIEQDVIEATEALPSGGDADSGSVNGLSAADDAGVSNRDIHQTRAGSGLRRTIADRMTESAKVPQVTLNRRVTVDSLLELKDDLSNDRNLELSLSDFLLSAVVDALEQHPEFNGIYEEGVHKLASKINIGIAVEIEDGLVTPVLEDAAKRSITEQRAERKRLVSLAQSGEFTMDDLSGGTFTVTNLGHFGVESFDPLLNPPQVAILGVGGVRTGYDPEADEPRRELSLSLTFDHRAVDGANAARFLQTLAEALEHPLRLLSFGPDTSNNNAQEPFLESSDGPSGERVATSQSAGGMQATVRSRRFEWAVDEPEDQGGEDTAPSPVEQFVGSLSSCLTLMIGHMADRRGVEIDDVTVTAQAKPPEGQIERIDIDIEIFSDAATEDVEAVVETAERACYVNQVISDDIKRELNVTIQ